jgi:hypothetical protein
LRRRKAAQFTSRENDMTQDLALLMTLWRAVALYIRVHRRGR